MSKKKAQKADQRVESPQQDPQESSEVVEQGSTMQGSTSSGSSTLPTSSESPDEDLNQEQSQDLEPNQNPSPIPPDARPAGMRSLKCVLTEDERSAYGMALAQFVTELEALEVQKANIPQQIKGVRERMRDTKSAMQNGFEYRDIDVLERDRGATIEIVRADTGEVVDVRAAKLDDRQTTIFDALDPGAENPLDGEPFTETDGDPESESTPDDPEDLF